MGQIGAPSTVVKKAKTLRGKLRPDEVWVVFDRDAWPCWPSAIDAALQARMKLAISNPCFEQWAILLHEDQAKDLHRHKVQSALSKVHRGYHHKNHPFLTLDAVLPHLDDAAARAKRINRTAKELGEPHRPSMTFFSDLVERLHQLKA